MIRSSTEKAGRRSTFSGWRAWVAAAFALLAGLFALSAPAAAETRSLKIKFVHTGEQAEVVFKRNGRYDRDGLNKLNRLLRDFRRNEPTKMDPRLFDVAWAIYRQTGARDYIHVLSGYRSPATNAWLKRTRGGQAEKSQHIQGKAMDFYIPGVSIKRIREIAMKQQGGGVGYYPRSGSPFVHIDVARVRAWPRMSRQELVRLFPDGKTLHLPPDGKPLPGYEAALAAYQTRQKSGDVIVASGGGKKASGILASLFGDDTEEEEEVGNEKPAAPKPVAVARAAPPAEAPQDVAPERNSIRETIVAALPGRRPAAALDAPRPEAEVGGGIQDVVGVPVEAAESPKAERANVPVPTRRPAHTPIEETQVASLGDAGVPVPSQRPGGEVELAALAPEPESLANIRRGDGRRRRQDRQERSRQVRRNDRTRRPDAASRDKAGRQDHRQGAAPERRRRRTGAEAESAPAEEQGCRSRAGRAEARNPAQCEEVADIRGAGGGKADGGLHVGLLGRHQGSGHQPLLRQGRRIPVDRQIPQDRLIVSDGR
ncbi:MAG: DUF882 domain-containing protein [Phyllobacteriaceae bacterium]|nr:DUF882 domain-containing protein [Phyllobacteriaceae bacterium]